MKQLTSRKGGNISVAAASSGTDVIIKSSGIERTVSLLLIATDSTGSSVWIKILAASTLSRQLRFKAFKFL